VPAGYLPEQELDDVVVNTTALDFLGPVVQNVRPNMSMLGCACARSERRRDGKGREGTGREGKGREGKGREGKGRDGGLAITRLKQ
jgi:hypothetical protein